jgi:hypothetical protein
MGPRNAYKDMLDNVCNILEFLWNVSDAKILISKFRFDVECVIKI